MKMWMTVHMKLTFGAYKPKLNFKVAFWVLKSKCNSNLKSTLVDQNLSVKVLVLHLKVKI